MEITSAFGSRLVYVLGVLLSSIAFVCARRFVARSRFARLHHCKPVVKSLNKDPWLGLDLIPSMIRNRQQHRILDESYKRFHTYGNTFKVTELLNHIIVTVEPENIKSILSINFKDYGIGFRQKAFEPLLGAGIFDTDGDHWAASRALIRPNFTRHQVADLRSFEELIQDLFSLLPRDGETVVDLQELFFRYSIDSATEFLFGQSVHSLRTADTKQSFAEAFDYAQKAILVKATFGPFGIFHRDQKAEDCNRVCRDFVKQFVDEAVHVVQTEKGNTGKANDEGGRQKYRVSHELARSTSDKTRILDELMNVLLAGRDTTASLLSNLFFMLAKNPEIWKKMRKEVSSLQGRVPTYDELQSLKYVGYCINESLRIHPVVPRNSRLALRDTVLPVGGGKDGLSPVFVPKGTLVAYNIYAMHRRTDFYGPDAEEFRPERWEDGRLKPRWEYLPFNGGPRICVGQRYALTEVAYVVVRMAQEFQTLRSRDSGPWEESLSFTLSSRNGTKVSLTPA